MVLIKRRFEQLKELLLDLKATWKQSGFKGLYKKYGWKLFAAFFIYYLIRDVTLYILIPWYIVNKAMN